MPTDKFTPEASYLRELPKDDKDYFLVCLGDIRRSLSKQTFNISIVLAEYIPQSGTKVDAKGNLTSKVTICNIDIGAIAVLTPGTIWKNGFLIKHPINYASKSSIELLEPSKTQIISFANSPYYSNIFQNIEEFRILENNHVIIDNENFKYDEKIGIMGFIIPCSEIIRHCFYSSTKIIHEIFHGGLKIDSIYNPVSSSLFRTEEGRKRVEIILRDGFGGTDALVASILFTSPYAKSTAENILENLTYQKQSGAIYVFPECKIPFEDDGRLSVYGKFIKLSANSWYFYVYYIEKARFQVSFEEYIYGQEVDRTQQKDVDKNSLPEKKNKTNSKDPIVAEEKVEVDTQKESDGRFLSYSFQVNNHDLFDMDLKNLGKFDKKNQKHKYSNHPIPTEVSVLTTDDCGKSNNGAANINFKQNQIKLDPKLDRTFINAFLESFFKAVLIINKSYPTRIIQVISNDEMNENHPDERFSYFHSSPQTDKTNKNWCFLYYYRLRWSERRSVIIVEINQGDYFCYLLEIEPRYESEKFNTFLIYNSKGSEILNPQLNFLLNECSEKMGRKNWWKNNSDSTIKGEFIRHKYFKLQNKVKLDEEKTIKAYIEKIQKVFLTLETNVLI